MPDDVVQGCTWLVGEDGLAIRLLCTCHEVGYALQCLVELVLCLKSARFRFGLAMMARFSFLFFQTKSWSANRVRLMTDLGGCEQRFDLRLYQIFLSGF
jgi:hypothetical protein